MKASTIKHNWRPPERQAKTMPQLPQRKTAPLREAASEDDIVAAVRGKGFARVYVKRAEFRGREDFERGWWWLLFVAARPGERAELWGRRRTLPELLQLAERGPIF